MKEVEVVATVVMHVVFFEDWYVHFLNDLNGDFLDGHYGYFDGLNLCDVMWDFVFSCDVNVYGLVHGVWEGDLEGDAVYDVLSNGMSGATFNVSDTSADEPSAGVTSVDYLTVTAMDNLAMSTVYETAKRVSAMDDLAVSTMNKTTKVVSTMDYSAVTVEDFSVAAMVDDS